MSVTKVCEKCGIGFDVPNRRSEQVRFCSRKCKTEAGSKSVECAVCKNLFSCEAHKDRKYCSRACFHAGAKGSVHAVKPDAPRYYKACEVCSKEFRVTFTRKDTARFCSNACKGSDDSWKTLLSEKMRGEKHHRWAGGLHKTHSGYIRRKRKTRDGEVVSFNHRDVVLEAMVMKVPEHPFLVQVDGEFKLSSDIEVHHIDRDRSNNALLNLIAVTKSAHAQIHHRGTKPKPWECWPSDPSAW
jgi:hypothetical protein